uniref:THAP-type domain-containing protein n=1 Tax=Ascaris lumbricoides TaxID=6252 RepID=A0A0M3IHF2_ASCLU
MASFQRILRHTLLCKFHDRISDCSILQKDCRRPNANDINEWRRRIKTKKEKKELFDLMR